MTELPLYKVLKDQTRQRILNLIGENGSASYTEILVSLNVSTGKLNYHLKILAPFVQKSNGSYILNETGESAYKTLKKFEGDETTGINTLYRPLTWLFLTVSVVLLFTGYFPAQIVGLVSMLVAVFFLYSSGKTEISISEMIVILAMATLVGSFGTLSTLNVFGYYKWSVTFGYYFSVPFLMGSIIIFSTFAAYSLNNRKRWLLALSVMIPVTLFFVIAVILSNYYYGPAGESSVVFPLPSVFLIIAAFSRIMKKFSVQQSSEVVDHGR